jgi:NADH-quinone oxidoreductase subunit G
LIGSAARPVAMVSSWGSNEELDAFNRSLGTRVTAYVKPDWTPQPGERLDDDLLIRADKNPNTTAARALFPLDENASAPLDAAADLVLVWGEGFDFARVPAHARTVVLNAYAHPGNVQADVFIPLSIQTERRGHYTNFQGVVSAFEPCFPKKASVADAEVLFAALAVSHRVPQSRSHA